MRRKLFSQGCSACLAILVCLLAALPAMGDTKLRAQEAITRTTKLTVKTYPAILSALQQVPYDTHWKEIPWRPSFGEAIEDARREDKPILLWVMNGHPCGMT